MSHVFVFGSNLAGIHGAGAAKTALALHGAEWGKGNGHYGDSYAIPTKDEFIHTLPLHEIREFVVQFIQYAKDHPELKFQLTAIGCGLAGYTVEDIRPMFEGTPPNVTWPPEFIELTDLSILKFILDHGLTRVALPLADWLERSRKHGYIEFVDTNRIRFTEPAVAALSHFFKDT